MTSGSSPVRMTTTPFLLVLVLLHAVQWSSFPSGGFAIAAAFSASDLRVSFGRVNSWSSPKQQLPLSIAGDPGKGRYHPSRPFHSNRNVHLQEDQEQSSSVPLPSKKEPAAVLDDTTARNALLSLTEESTPSTTTVSAEPEAATVFAPPASSEPVLGLWAARGLLLLVAAIWGTNFASVKYLEGLCFHPPCHHPPSEFALARFGVAALVSLPLLIGQPIAVIWAGLECGLTITLGYVTQAMALATIPSGECAFICSLTVVFVPLAAAILYGKPIRPANIAAAAVALAGVGVLEGLVDVPHWIDGANAAALPIDPTTTTTAASALAASAPSALQASSGAVANPLPAFLSSPLESLSKTLGVESGDILALGQPIGFGYSFLRIEHYQEQFKDVPNRVLTIAAAQCVCVGVLSLLWVLHDYNGVLPDFGYLAEPHRIATILWTGIVTTVAAIYLEGLALQTASATDASIAFASEPVWASLFGFWLLHEQLGLNSYVGGAIILSACLLGALSDLKPSSTVLSESPPPTVDP